MDKKNKEQWWNELAMRYTQEDGKRLHQEMDKLVQDQMTINTRNLDKKVRHKLRVSNYWKYTTGLGVLVAACFVLVFTFVWKLAEPGRYKDNSNINDESMVREESSKEDAENSKSSSLELPDHFAIEEKIEEADKTTYYISNSSEVMVTVIVEAGSLLAEYTALPVMSINGQTVYGGEAEQMLAFEKDGYTYIMFCEQEFEVLMELGAFIL